MPDTDPLIGVLRSVTWRGKTLTVAHAKALADAVRAYLEAEGETYDAGYYGGTP